ncbi:MAG: filamentous hemagglutinin family protein [Verrucomicrobiota bacterium]
MTVGVDLPNGQPVDQGVLTVDGGNINIFANNDVAVGTSRIFTLHGGNVIIWSTNGSIAAGASSKTVVSAPPTQVIVDPTSGAVETDLAGLATGGGIGVLESVVGAPPGDVDLIAPNGTVDAGDAGIRASGNINIAALKVLNADNISAGGKTTGVPTGPSINLGALAAASSAAGSSTAAAENAGPSRQNPQGTGAGQELPSIVTVEVLGFGGGDNDN